MKSTVLFTKTEKRAKIKKGRLVYLNLGKEYGGTKVKLTNDWGELKKRVENYY